MILILIMASLSLLSFHHSVVFYAQKQQHHHRLVVDGIRRVDGRRFRSFLLLLLLARRCRGDLSFTEFRMKSIAFILR